MKNNNVTRATIFPHTIERVHFATPDVNIGKFPTNRKRIKCVHVSSRLSYWAYTQTWKTSCFPSNSQHIFTHLFIILDEYYVVVVSFIRPSNGTNMRIALHKQRKKGHLLLLWIELENAILHWVPSSIHYLLLWRMAKASKHH